MIFHSLIFKFTICDSCIINDIKLKLCNERKGASVDAKAEFHSPFF
jgi:hypothetical protein